VLPFSFKLPENIPGTMKMSIPKQPGQPEELVQIKYTVEMWVDGLKNELWHEFEFDLRQFWFTNQEIKDNIEEQRKQNLVKQMFRKQASFRPLIKRAYKADEIFNIDPRTSNDNKHFYEGLEIYFVKKAQHIDNKEWTMSATFERLPTCCPGIFGGASNNDMITASISAKLSRPIYF
jgi:hypothetical protein